MNSHSLRSRWLSRGSGLPAGTVYPILQRLTAAKWMTSRWEPAEGRPLRRYYSLTTEGRASAVHALEEAAQRAIRLTGLLPSPPSGEHT
jgi:PadR family transcriptional regulator, regulatory protein PadR